jgi:hypothetical protein
LVTARRNEAIARALLEALPDGHRGSATRLFVGREINDLPALLARDELPVRAATGRRSGGSVLVIATDRRVLIIDRERDRSEVIVIEFTTIEAVVRARGAFTIGTRDGRSFAVQSVPREMVSHFADWLAVHIAGARAFQHTVAVETGTAEPPVDAARPTRFLPGGYRVDVVGESFHNDTIREVVGAAGHSFGGTLLWASLVPDFENPYDASAVKVVINGRDVGHLSREAAGAFRGVAERIRDLGCDARCAATVIGGGRGGIFGVVLDLGTPDACLGELGEKPAGG